MVPVVELPPWTSLTFQLTAVDVVELPTTLVTVSVN